MGEKISLFEWSKLPTPFGVTVLILSLIFLLSPYLSGTDFGIFKIPPFSETAKRYLRIIGPIVFLLCVFSFLPLWTASRVGRTVGTANANSSSNVPNANSDRGGFVNGPIVSTGPCHAAVKSGLISIHEAKTLLKEELGFYRGEINDVDDNEFRDAVKIFQRANGLQPDGCLGPNSAQALKRLER